jgi:DNA-binding transcriptional LysR family regulator
MLDVDVQLGALHTDMAVVRVEVERGGAVLVGCSFRFVICCKAYALRANKVHGVVSLRIDKPETLGIRAVELDATAVGIDVVTTHEGPRARDCGRTATELVGLSDAVAGEKQRETKQVGRCSERVDSFLRHSLFSSDCRFEGKITDKIDSIQIGNNYINNEYYSTMDWANLDLDTLRTLVVANEVGGYGQAAERLGRTPSAVSLQMKRLQEDVGAKLFRKSGRGTELTETGEIVLRYSRKMLALNDELLHTVRGASLSGSVRLGCSQDFAETVLPQVLSKFTKLYPLVQMEVRIEGNSAMVDAIESGQLDVALALGQSHRDTAEVLGALELVWIAGEQFVPRKDQQLPLVLLGPQCAFRKEAIQKLDEAKIPWRIAAVSPSLAGLWASAVAGLGITVRSALGLPPKLVQRREMFGLPVMGSFPVTLHTRTEGSSDGVESLRAIVRKTVASTLSVVGRRAGPTGMRSR